VIDVQPANDTIGLICPDLQEFIVDLWDPDEEDFAYFGAQIHATWTQGASGGWDWYDDCDPPTAISALPDDPAGYDSGVLVRITCKLPLNLFNINESDPRLLVLVQVSDLGFFSQSQVREGARTAEVVWALDLLPDEGCP
jgi:hypothetical protein